MITITEDDTVRRIIFGNTTATSSEAIDDYFKEFRAIEPWQFEIGTYKIGPKQRKKKRRLTK